ADAPSTHPYELPGSTNGRHPQPAEAAMPPSPATVGELRIEGERFQHLPGVVKSEVVYRPLWPEAPIRGIHKLTLADGSVWFFRADERGQYEQRQSHLDQAFYDTSRHLHLGVVPTMMRASFNGENGTLQRSTETRTLFDQRDKGQPLEPRD